MIHLLYQIFVQPAINLIVLFYSFIPGHDFGVAVILLTILVRVIVWPLQSKTLRNQKALNKIQPDIKKIQAKYKNDPTKMNSMLMELYKEKEVNPLSSCLPSLIQLPLLFALYYAIRHFANADFINITNHTATGVWAQLYGWIKNLGAVKTALGHTFSTSMLGLINLAKPSWILAVIAGIAQFFQTKMLMPKQNLDASQKMLSQTVYLFPAITIIIGLSFPAALPLYWIVTTAIALLQQYLVMGRDIEKLEEEK